MLDEEQLIDSAVDVSATRVVRYLASSEGRSIVDEFTLYAIQVEAWARADDGMLLDNGRSFYARDVGDMPSPEAIQHEVDMMVRQLVELRNAPTIDPYTGPAILAGQASGVLFHEAVGHRLEGERQRDEEEGRTFKGRVGKVVIPEFITVIDDPTRQSHNDKPLNGFYEFDDQGIEAQPALLVEKGVLRGFLKSRAPIEGSPHSNGHGRAQGPQQAMARMANTIVETSADKSVPYDELKKMLLAEVRKQGKPYGLIIKDITGGSTNTSGYGYQAFKGSPRLIYRVDPHTGVETLVRGAELVGTPLTSINKIVAASVETDVFNGYCGAESGYVPVSAVAPALLTTEIELQRTQQSSERPPILRAPWLGDKLSAPVGAASPARLRRAVPLSEGDK
jgi:predicted Zn-dependent protease